MKLRNINEATEWFEVLQTSKQSQTAIMTLAPGDSTGEKAEAHRNSEQVLLVLEGKLNGEVDDQRPTLEQGSVIIIPAGVKHRFTNPGRKPAITFNVYAPPAYPANTRG